MAIPPGLVAIANGTGGTPDRADGSPGATVPYASSADRFPLSFLEWLPQGYRPTVAYPLFVYFHGMGPSLNWTPGGLGGTTVPPAVVQAVLAAPGIIISLNTRSEAGFYANTPCGGPQEQDVLDAIALEKSRRAVASTDFIGFSMGSLGALTVAARHPGLARGVAMAGPITDLFQAVAYAESRGGRAPVIADLCGVRPGPGNASAVRFFIAESPARFMPSNLSALRIYLTAGGRDTAAPNNYALWPYAQANSTFVNYTCSAVAALGEPVTCTTPFRVLAASHPGLYVFRYVYEARAPHTPDQLPATDMVRFLTGHGSTGFYTAGFPPTIISAVPPPG